MKYFNKRISRAVMMLLALSLAGCANPLNKTTYYRYLEAGATAEKQADAATAEIAYSRALGNVYMGNLGPEREAEALFNLGRLERLNGKLQQSLEHLLKSLEIDESKNNAKPEIIKSTLGEIAKTCYEMKAYEKGVIYLERLHAMGLDSFRSPQSKRFIHDIFSEYAEILDDLGMADKADKFRNASPPR
ncbi:MAG: tetratricopeptide repeat protein [Candidatus Thiodiazotropha sp.]